MVNKGSSSLHSRLENQELGRRQSRNYGSDQANPRGLGAGDLQLRMSLEGWKGGWQWRERENTKNLGLL